MQIRSQRLRVNLLQFETRQLQGGSYVQTHQDTFSIGVFLLLTGCWFQVDYLYDVFDVVNVEACGFGRLLGFNRLHFLFGLFGVDDACELAEDFLLEWRWFWFGGLLRFVAKLLDAFEEGNSYVLCEKFV